MNENIIARIKQIMAAKDIGQAELVRRTGLPASSISDWLSGKYAPKQDKIDIMAAALGVSPAWLMYGTDEVESYYTNPETVKLMQESDVQILLDAKRNLPPEDYQYLVNLAKRLLNRN